MTVDSASVQQAVEHAVREIERHAASVGWDRSPRLFALVPSAELLAAEPELASRLGMEPKPSASALTPVEQDDLTFEEPLEQLLAGIEWPQEVVGAALVLETVVLPGGTREDTLGPGAARRAVDHPDREDARVAVAVHRGGERASALRFRRHDNDTDVVTGADLAPALAVALATTLVSARTRDGQVDSSNSSGGPYGRAALPATEGAR